MVAAVLVSPAAAPADSVAPGTFLGTVGHRVRKL